MVPQNIKTVKEHSMRTVKNITQGNIYKNYLLFAAPLIFSSILGSLYSTVDAMIAGKFISEHWEPLAQPNPSTFCSTPSSMVLHPDFQYILLTFSVKKIIRVLNAMW